MSVCNGASYIDDLLKMIDFFINNDTKEKIYNVSTGGKIDLVSLANKINDVSDFQSEIILLNKGLNNEYTSSNKRILNEMGGFDFTSHQEAILKMRGYFKHNLESLETAVIQEDRYLKMIDTIWKKG